MAGKVIAEGLGFPEGPAFDRRGNLYVVEIQGGQVSRIAPDGQRSLFARTGGGPNGSAFGPDGNLYVCNNGGFPRPGTERERGRIERITPGGAVSVLIDRIDGDPLASPNDLCFDAHGNFYFTDPVWGANLEEAPPGGVCFSDLSGRARQLHTGLKFPNGIGVTPDGTQLLVCESITSKLHAFEILAPGVLSPPTEFARLPDGAIPDGFAFDEAGNVLCCGFRSGKIHVFPPQGGARIGSIDFEDPQVTNVCFGGPGRRTLFVTESGLGRVVAVEWERPGHVLFPDR
jgi:gluconolactonase